MRVLLILASSLLIAAIAMTITDPVHAQTDPPSSGDWDITDTTVVENRTVQLRGNLTIGTGGSLTLRNVTLQVFCSASDNFGINVSAGGTLVIEDVDGNRSTSSDRSVVMRGSPSWGYFFIAKPGSNLSIANSMVTGSGGQMVSRGVSVRTNNATFIGVTFVDGDEYGLSVRDTSGTRISFCSFHYAENGLVLKNATGITVEDCLFTLNSRSGILIDNSTDVSLRRSNSSQNNVNGLVVTGSSDILVMGSTFSENIRGIVLGNVRELLASGCQINSSIWDGLVIEGGAVNVSLEEMSIFGNGRSGIDGRNVTNLSMENCLIHNCTYFGIRLLVWTDGLDMRSCEVVDNGYNGVHIDHAQAINLDGNRVYSNGYNGIFAIDCEALFIKGDEYHSNGYDGLNCDQVHGLSVDLCKAWNNTYNGIYLQAGTNHSAISRCTLDDNGRGGIELSSAFDVEITWCNISQNLDFGIRVNLDAHDIVISECNLLNNAQGGLRMRNSHSLQAANLTIMGGGTHEALHVESSYDVWLKDSLLPGIVDVSHNGNVTIVSPETEAFVPRVEGGSWLDLAYWVQVKVVWPDDSPVSGAIVNITSVNGTRRHGVLTNDAGMTEVLPVTVRTWEGGPAIERNPTTVHATMGIESASERLTIVDDMLVRIVLLDSIPPVPVMEDVVAELGALTLMDGTASHDNGLLVSWTWTFEDGVGTVELVGPTASWTFNVLGTYEGQLNVTDSAGLWNTTDFTISVIDTTAPVVVLGDDLLVNQNTHVDLNGTGATDNDSTLVLTGTFEWTILRDGNPVPVHTTSGPVKGYVFVEMGVYTVVLVVTDQSGNSDEASFKVTVRDTTPPSVDAGPDVFIDQGLPVTLEPSRITDNDPAFDPLNSTIRWRIQGAGLDQNLTGHTVMWTSPEMGVYQAIVYVSDEAGNVGTDAMTITVWDTVQPLVDLGEDRTVNITSTVTLDARGTRDNDPAFPKGASYAWTVTGPQLVLETSGVEVTFQVPWVGTYEVVLSVTDATGNVGEDTLRLESVDPWDPVFGAFSPLPGELLDDGDVTVTIAITDQGMGVNSDLVEMRLWGPTEDDWGTWQVVDAGDSSTSVLVSLQLELPEGSTLIQFRCWDLAENGPVISPEHPVRVNSRPVVVVLSPVDGADYGPKDEIWLDASPTHDVDEEDVLTYLWTSHVDGPLGSAPRVRAKRLSPGEHEISLLVSDGVEGHEVLVTVTISVAPEPSTVSTDSGTSWYVVAAILLLLAGTLYVLWDARRRRKGPPPTVDDQGEEWVETTGEGGVEDQQEGPRAVHLNSKRLTGAGCIEAWVL